ncbi:MAG: flagellar biosynthesis anti-sigma factor FlgM [Clostridiales bacterium]|nr:flagellar biosynthesis anti-sigma factor FlgM [Clostridiales bacterium]
MKISGEQVQKALQSYLKEVQEKRAREAQAPSQGRESRDQVAISREARVLSRWVAQVGQQPDLHEARVKELEEQVARGEYRPSAEEIARQILRRSLVDGRQEP